jgi:hyperosmotically inducible protein
MKVKNTINLSIIVAIALTSFNLYADSVASKVGQNVNDASTAVGDSVEKVSKDIATVASDTAITAKIKAKLALESDIPLNISVSTANGVVTLSGTVDTGLQANRIIDIAAGVEGVKDINDSQLHVTNSEHFFSDAAITTKAKFKIMELSDKGQIEGTTNLHVETTNGDIHVFGTVTQKADISTIKQALSAIEGVKSVKTNIEVVKE